MKLYSCICIIKFLKKSEHSARMLISKINTQTSDENYYCKAGNNVRRAYFTCKTKFFLITDVVILTFT